MYRSGQLKGIVTRLESWSFFSKRLTVHRTRSAYNRASSCLDLKQQWPGIKRGRHREMTPSQMLDHPARVSQALY